MDVNICIIGAGVVGLAIAKKLSETHNDIIMLDRNSTFGQETSSRNSEVIHSGIYYPKNSLKAELCVLGNTMLYEYCKDNGIAHKKTGKLIISQSEQEDAYLQKLLHKAPENNVEGVKLINQETINSLEPHIIAKKALLVPSTGIIDSHGLMKQLLAHAEKNGVQIAFKSDISNIEKISSGYLVSITEENGSSFEFTAKRVINSAGLESDTISNMLFSKNGYEKKYELNYCKGEYFRILPPKNKLVKRLIYPTPFKNLQGLGIHATIELDGGLKLGPSIIYTNNRKLDYRVDESNLDHFYQAASIYFPFLEKEDLISEMAGIRPKLQRKNGPIHDFVIRHETGNGFPEFYNLVGIESPGLTASLAIAEHISKLISS